MKRTSPFQGSQIADSFPLHLDLPPVDAAGGQTEEPSMQPDSRSSPHYSDRTRPMITYREAADLMVISPRTLQRAAAGWGCGGRACRPSYRPDPQGRPRCLDRK